MKITRRGRRAVLSFSAVLKERLYLSEEESISRLRKLGLNLYESRAYVALLNAEQLTAKGVGQSALIPQSRTYDVLESLTRKGFAMATPTSPHSYIPVPPAEILGSHYDSERKKIQERVAILNEEAQAKLEGVREAYLALTKDYTNAPRERGPESDRVWVLQERKNIERTLVGLIRDSKSEVLRITKPPELKRSASLDPFYIVGLENQQFVSDALQRGVKMKWLSLAREVPTYLGLDVSEPPERRYIESDEDITEKFLLVDNHSVLLNIHDPLSPTYGSVALAMQSKAVSYIFRDHFEKIWKKGKPLRDLLPKMKKSVDDLCAELAEKGLGKAEVTLYKTLARLGATTQDVLSKEMTKKKFQFQDTPSLTGKLVRMGLVHRDEAHRLLLVEHPLSVRASMSAGKLKFDSGARVTTS